MPVCRQCGNNISFGCSSIIPVAPTANGPVSGLMANFDHVGNIIDMESMGAELDEAQEAYEDPRNFFDTCFYCGSHDIDWFTDGD